jgi:hypothetical protein
MIPALIASLGGGHDLTSAETMMIALAGGGTRTSMDVSSREGVWQIGARGTGMEIGEERAQLHY